MGLGWRFLQYSQNKACFANLRQNEVATQIIRERAANNGRENYTNKQDGILSELKELVYTSLERLPRELPATVAEVFPKVKHNGKHLFCPHVSKGSRCSKC